MATSSREARRRKIMERSSDRLALITGRIQSLPSPSTISSPPHDSLPALSSTPLTSHLTDQSSVSSHVLDKDSGSMLLKHDSDSESGLVDINNGGTRVEPHLGKGEASIEAVRHPASEVSDKVHSSILSSASEKTISPSGTEQQPEKQIPYHRFFNPKQISFAITASESTRIFCSVIVAALGVLSHLGFPLLGSNFMKTFIFSRPLFLVLLTNLTIVLAQLFEKQKGLDRAEKGASKVSSEDGYGWAEQIGQVLEVGLVFQKIVDTVFMDCSVYVMVVICGLSLLTKFS
ncbi:uncharacterized protein LOC131150583 [Malania oleifera]|uniref:uncharacterized protein LOC131150583 n=1 Tax=Malania oleifera TaxID=397392 RepID=UPI0025AE70E3|nr:uncharacterized protein LOC131150583 [Malania oleifera]